MSGNVLHAGARLGAYTIEAVLGRGGMGVTYRARDARGAKVAIKVLLPEIEGDKDALRRFAREAAAAAKVRHENVARLVAAGEADGHRFIVFELVTGGSLAARIAREGARPWREAVRLALPLARGLEAIHAAGVVHRDLKPDNVLLGEGGVPKIVDFGLVRRAPGRSSLSRLGRLTQQGEFLGTPAFMPPEQVSSPEEVDERADLYAFGATVFALLTGRPPFTGEGLVLLSSLLNDPPPRPSSYAEDVPRELDDLIHALLAKSPDDRPRSARAVVAALEALGGAAAPVAAPVRISREKGPNRAVLVTLAIFAIAIGGSIVGLALARPGTPRPAGTGEKVDTAALRQARGERERAAAELATARRELGPARLGLAPGISRKRFNGAFHAFEAACARELDLLPRGESRERHELEALRDRVHDACMSEDLILQGLALIESKDADAPILVLPLGAEVDDDRTAFEAALLVARDLVFLAPERCETIFRSAADARSPASIARRLSIKLERDAKSPALALLRALEPHAGKGDAATALAIVEAQAYGRLEGAVFESERAACTAFVSSWSKAPAVAREAFPELALAAARGARARFTTFVQELKQALAAELGRAIALACQENTDRLGTRPLPRELAPAFESLGSALAAQDPVLATHLLGQALRADPELDLHLPGLIQRLTALKAEALDAHQHERALEIVWACFRVAESVQWGGEEEARAARDSEKAALERPDDWARVLAFVFLIAIGHAEGKRLWCTADEVQRALARARDLIADERLPLAARGLAGYHAGMILATFPEHRLEAQPLEAAQLIARAHENCGARDEVAAQAAIAHARAWVALGKSLPQREAAASWARLALAELHDRVAGHLDASRKGGVPLAPIQEEDWTHETMITTNTVDALVAVGETDLATASLDRLQARAQLTAAVIARRAIVAYGRGEDDTGDVLLAKAAESSDPLRELMASHVVAWLETFGTTKGVARAGAVLVRHGFRENGGLGALAPKK